MTDSWYKKSLFLLSLSALLLVSLILSLHKEWLLLPLLTLPIFLAKMIGIVVSILLCLFSITMFGKKHSRDYLYLASIGLFYSLMKLMVINGYIPDQIVNAFQPEMLVCGVLLVLTVFSDGEVISAGSRVLNFVLVALLAVVVPLVLLYVSNYWMIPPDYFSYVQASAKLATTLLLIAAVVRFFIVFEKKRFLIYFWFLAASLFLLFANASMYFSGILADGFSFYYLCGWIAALLCLLIAVFSENTRFMESEIDIRKSLEKSYLSLAERFEAHQKLIHSIDVGIMALDGEGVVTLANERLSRMLGVEKSELTGRSQEALFDITNLEKFLIEKEKWTSGLNSHFEIEMKTAGDGRGTFIILAVPEKTGLGAYCGVHLTVLDASSWKAQEKQFRTYSSDLEKEITSLTKDLEEKNVALEQQQDYHEKVVTGIMDVLLILDNEGNCTYINEYGRKVLGYKAGELTRKRLPDFITDLESLRRNYGDSMKIELLGHEADFRTKSGKKLLFNWHVKYLTDVNGNRQSVLCVGRDITEYKTMQAQINAHSEDLERIVGERTTELNVKLAQLVKMLKAGEDIILNSDLKKVLAAIADSIQMLGWKKVVLVRRSEGASDPVIEAYKGFRPDGLKKFVLKRKSWFKDSMKYLRNENKIGDSYLMSEDKGADRIPLTILNGEGADSWNIADALITPIKMRNRILGFIYVIEPVVRKIPQSEDLKMLKIFAQRAAAALENSRLYTEMQARIKELETTNRIKMGFFTNMSHELRTPLNSIMAITGILNKKLAGDLNDEQQHQIQIVQKNGERLIELINDILDLSKIEAGRMELKHSYFALRDSLETTVEMIRPLYDKKGLRIDLKISKTAPQYIFTDKDKLEQVLMNLLANAVKHTQRGKIVVSADGKNELIISIKDTGSGIDKQEIETIFEPFRQSRDEKNGDEKGTGLGLSISKQLWEMMGGTISVQSKKTKGTTFELKLPIDEFAGEVRKNSSKSPSIKARAQSKKAKNNSGKTRILLVDDNPDNQYALKYILEEEGYHVLFARDGAEGVRIALEEKPSLILMDLMMPGKDGYQATRDIRNHRAFKKIPIVAMTAKTKEEDDGKALIAGCSDYLSKPFKAELVVKKIATWLKGAK